MEPMSPPRWTEEHGKLLKDLRQKAGLDTATLARKHLVSSSQIGQLENGGDAAFYNADIKFATGKKLLRVLGHDLPEPAVALNEVESLSPQAFKVTQGLPSPSFSVTPQKTFWFLLFLLIALGLLGLYVDSLNTSSKVTTTPPMTGDTSSATATQAENINPQAATPAEPNNPTLQPAVPLPTPAPVPAEGQAVTTSKLTCNWNSSHFEVQPETPRKTADYVHLRALKSVVVCVKDAEQRVATLELEAGNERSIYGPAPFSVYSTQLSQLNVYFQGQLVKLPNDTLQHLKLTAATR
jgi:transcriptional regulator with XRE-family HTH domain